MNTPDKLSEHRRLRAIAMADEVFKELDRIAELRRQMIERIRRFDPDFQTDGGKRDCAAFQGRVDELDLRYRVLLEFDLAAQDAPSWMTGGAS